MLQQYGVQHLYEEEDSFEPFNSGASDPNPNFTDSGFQGISGGSSGGVRAICSIGGPKKQVQILQKSPMFIDNPQHGKTEGKTQILLANGPLAIKGKHLIMSVLSRVLIEKIKCDYDSNSLCQVCNVFTMVATLLVRSDNFIED